MRKIVQPVQKTENADVVAASPLAATGVEKMILVIRQAGAARSRSGNALRGGDQTNQRAGETQYREISPFFHPASS